MSRSLTRRDLAAFILLSSYLLWFRTHGVSESFWLRGDQIRDWTIALRDLTDLPLSGVPSTAGGTTLGPAYYWFLWLVARTVGPFTGYLPHAGGIGISLLQSVADGVLFLALARVFATGRKGPPYASTLLSPAIVLTAATSGYDATLSSTIWNPPVATAFAKLAMAVVLWDREITLLRSALAVMASWIAVQCHTSGVLVAIPVIGWVVGPPVFARRWTQAGARAGATMAVILMLQVPWMLARVTQPPTNDSRIARSLTAVASAPARTIHPVASAAFVARSLHFNLIAPFDEDQEAVWPFAFVLAAAALATVFLVRDMRVTIVSVVPLAMAVVLFAFWQGALDQFYWCLVIVPTAAIAMWGWIDRVRPRWRGLATGAALLLVLVAQPARAEMAWTLHRLPYYGALVRGCRAGDVRPPADVPADVDVAWLCSLVRARR